MQSETVQQVVALLQEVGIFTPEAAEAAWQKVVLHDGQPMGVEAPALVIPIDRAGAAGADERTVDEYHINDQQLQAVLLQSGRLTLAQLDTAVREQQVTGHPLWRTVINLELLTPQEMTALIKTQGAPGQAQILSSATGTAQEPEQALESQPRRDVAQHLIEADETATAVQMVNTIFAEAIQARATDIHIEPQVPRMRVRYRIDGMLFDVLTVPPALEMSIISRIKVLAEMNITERRLPQDGRLSFRLGEQEYNMRVATIPTVQGEKLVLRLLTKSNVLTGLKQLGLEPDDEQRLRSLIAKPQGMILATGPIGSGKTTTLYAALNEVNILTNNIVTIEDPIEYQLAGINQVEVDPKIGLTFASGLRSILRQDADILMVGEVRDVETATVAVRAALTGQQLFSTLHTIDAPSAITTLGNFGIQPYLIASALSGVVAQRLVRKICPECRQWYTPSPAVLRQLGLVPEQQEGPNGPKSGPTDAPISTPTQSRQWRFAYGVGCAACYYTGYLGRTGLFEILRVSATLRQLITEQASEQEIQAAAVREGMHTLQQNGIAKIIQGITTPPEVMREVYL